MIMIIVFLIDEGIFVNFYQYNEIILTTWPQVLKSDLYMFNSIGDGL